MIGRALFGTDPAVASERRAAFLQGARAATPALAPTAIWGLVAGVAMIKTGLTTPQALAMTLLVFSGSAQLASLPLIAAGAPVWVAMMTAGMVNLRFVIFSATLWPYFGSLVLRKRLLLGYLSVDIGVAVFIARYAGVSVEERGNLEQRWFFLGIALASWLSWQSMSILGILLAEGVPTEWGLDFAAILALIAITVPMFAGRAAIAGSLTAGAVSVAGAGLPWKLGLVLAVVAGVTVAMLLDAGAEPPHKGED